MPALPQFESSVKTGTLIDITLANGVDSHFQNYLPGQAIAWGTKGYLYQYCPIAYKGAAKSLELDNSSITVTVPNIPLIGQFVWDNDGLRDAVLQIFKIFPSKPGTPTFALDIMRIASSKFKDSYVEIEAQQVTSAVGAVFPSIYWRTGSGSGRVDLPGLVPAMPRTNEVRVS